MIWPKIMKFIDFPSQIHENMIELHFCSTFNLFECVLFIQIRNATKTRDYFKVSQPTVSSARKAIGILYTWYALTPMTPYHTWEHSTCVTTYNCPHYLINSL